jgi:hypothetical protein
MVDAVHRRLPGTAVDAVAAAVMAAGLTQCGLARFVNRLQKPVGAEWPKAAMTGDVAYRLAVALHEAGILDRVPPCTHCGRPRLVSSRGSAPPTCGACGPRNADGTKARSADPGKSVCPAGFHRVPAYTVRCDACADDVDTVFIQDAILKVGASAELARTVISKVLLSRMSRRRVAEWLRAGNSMRQSCRTSPRRAVLAAGESVGSFLTRVRTAVSARTATEGRREGSRPAGPAGRSATLSGATMTAGPGAPRAAAAIPISLRSASAAAELGKLRRERQRGQSAFAAIGLPLNGAADAFGTAQCQLEPVAGRSASPARAAPWSAAPTAGKNGSFPGCGPGGARGGALSALRGPRRRSRKLAKAMRRTQTSMVFGWLYVLPVAKAAGSASCRTAHGASPAGTGPCAGERSAVAAERPGESSSRPGSAASASALISAAPAPDADLRTGYVRAGAARGAYWPSGQQKPSATAETPAA